MISQQYTGELETLQKALLPSYKDGAPQALVLEPHQTDLRYPKYREVLEFVLQNVGILDSRGTVYISAYSHSLEMAHELSQILYGEGIDSAIVVHPGGDIREDLFGYLKNPEQFEGLVDDIAQLSERSSHMFVPYGVINYEHSSHVKNVSGWYDQVRGRRIFPLLDKMALDGILKSWDMVLCPTEDEARNAGLPFQQYEQMMFDAILKAKEVEAAADELKARMEGKSQIRISGNGTQLVADISKRRINRDIGKAGVDDPSNVITNYPPGEIFVSPIETSVKGWLHSPRKVNLHAQTVRGLSLTISGGLVVDAEAEEGIDGYFAYAGNLTDESTKANRVVAEIGLPINRRLLDFGRNYSPTTNSLIDEKCAVHIGFGDNKSYGGENEAALHYDIPLGNNVVVLVDGERIFEEFGY